MKTIKVDGIEIPLTPELIKAVKEAEEKPERWIPKFGDVYWSVTDFVEECTWGDFNVDNYSLKQNNVFKTLEEAKMAEHRDRLNRTLSTDFLGEQFWVWDFETEEPLNVPSKCRHSYLNEICFGTKEECEAWGKGDGELKGAQEVYEYFYNLRNQ